MLESRPISGDLGGACRRQTAAQTPGISSSAGGCVQTRRNLAVRTALQVADVWWTDMTAGHGCESPLLAVRGEGLTGAGFIGRSELGGPQGCKCGGAAWRSHSRAAAALIGLISCSAATRPARITVSGHCPCLAPCAFVLGRVGWIVCGFITIRRKTYNFIMMTVMIKIELALTVCVLCARSYTSLNVFF